MDVKMDYRKLKGRIVEIYGTNQAFAAAMNMPPSMLSTRLSGVVQWRADEIAQACELLEIPLAEAPIYFFTKRA